ncbi:MAG: npdA, partial [Actinomycetia bacterium]|nr:npdA [Actinomycetes bacterium]
MLADLDLVRCWVHDAERLVVLTGAGISTDSGIPDFRGPNGVWTKNPAAEKASTLQHWVGDPEVRKAGWRARLDSGMFQAEPNGGHHALAELDRRGRLHLLVTQNIDGLHHAAGVDPSRIVEVHGNVREWACLTCGARGPMAEALDRVRAGEDDPPCPACGGIIKSATISFGQSLVPDDIQRAEEGALEADVLLAVGSTLQVYPVAGMVPLAKRAG